MLKNSLSFILITIYLFLISGSNCYASSVRHVTVDEMLQHCQFVFEGEVLVLESIETSPKRIHTYVTFGIQDIIKGEYSKNTITLTFLGGTVGNKTMAVSDMKIPQAGERGIYFVESLEQMQVHPLYGWSQGHFLVQEDETGTDRIMTSSEQPVTAIMQNDPVDPMISSQESTARFSRGVALGVVSEFKNQGSKGITAKEFKEKLRKILE